MSSPAHRRLVARPSTSRRPTLSERVTPELLEAGKRASDTVNSYLNWYDPMDIRNKVIAFKLADGTYDGTLYDSKRDAVRHQHGNEQWYAYFYFRNCLGGTNAKEMAIFLLWNRDAYDAGARMPDPDDVNGGRDVLITAARGDQYRDAVLDAEARRLLDQLPQRDRDRLMRKHFPSLFIGNGN